MSDNKTISDLKLVVESLMDCELKNKTCRKCKMRKKGCLLFLRDCIAVALQFIITGLPAEGEAPEGLYQ